MKNNHTSKGECEFCGDTDVKLFVQHGDMMCEGCIAKENAVAKSSAIVEESRAKDARIELKSDIMQAATTSFIELQGAISNNPEVAEDNRKYALALEAAERIRQFDLAIFAHDAKGVEMKNERMAWLKNTQALVATLKADQREKFKHLNLQYKPTTVTPKEPKVKKSAKQTDSGKKPSSRTFSNAELKAMKEACAKNGITDIVSIRMMMIRNRTLEQAIALYLESVK